jgi:hypothetical protein
VFLNFYRDMGNDMGPTESCQKTALGKAKDAKLGQSGIEFLFLIGIMSTIFLIIVLVSYQGQLDISSLSSNLEAQRVCHELAFRISSISASGEGTIAGLGIPEKIAGNNYTVFISGPDRGISISHIGGLAGCPLPTSGISNGTGAGSSDKFYIKGGEIKSLKNSGRGVVVE